MDAMSVDRTPGLNPTLPLDATSPPFHIGGDHAKSFAAGALWFARAANFLPQGVLLNLIVNSAHAIASVERSFPGKITIHTWCGSSNVYCSVADDGPGIPIEVRNRIFDPFFTTKEPGKGTGLGLSISYDIIVNKHGGTLSVACPSEKGTVFTLSLPLTLTTEGTGK
jgi:C4-dicarboxylate-specific signal transduction histidine kinase